MDFKNQKYDRQLRLWNASGQTHLEESHIALFNASVTGTEALKNLILPGIKAFTIFDTQLVDQTDISKNFFIDVKKVNETTKRGELITELLGELNDLVSSNYEDTNLNQFLNFKSDQITNFNLVILSKDIDTADEDIISLSKLCELHNIPLILTETVGFVGYLKVSGHEHTVIETHPESLVDLRIVDPFPELLQFVGEFGDIDQIQDIKTYNEVPSVVILLYYLQKWKETHDGSIPSNFKEKTQFKAMLRKTERFPNLDNLNEAIDYVTFHVQPYRVPRDTLALFESSQLELNERSSEFWILVKSLKDFYENEGLGKSLPLTGVVPDIRTSTISYVKLKQTYQTRADLDKATFANYVRKHLIALNRPEDVISTDTITTFCKHASFLKVVHYDSIHQEYSSPLKLTSSLFNQQPDAWFYFALKARHLFIRAHGQVPGVNGDSNKINEDAVKIQEFIRPLLSEWGLMDVTIPQEYLVEVCRSGTSELTTTASIVGGLVAQESIKLITRQYIPIDDIALFNGVKGSIATFKIKYE